jgi:hypothetical protein
MRSSRYLSTSALDNHRGVSVREHALCLFQCVLVDSPSPYDSQMSGARTDTPFLL